MPLRLRSVCLWACLLASSLRASEPPPSAAPKAEARRVQTLTLRGSAFERGRRHGEHFGGAIGVLLARWRTALAAEAKQPAEVAIREFLQSTDFLPAIRRWTPDLLEELRGLAEGAGRDFDEMLAFQLGDEFYGYHDLRGHEHCSALGVAGRDGQPGWIAQNMDLEPIYDGFQTVLRIQGEAGAPEQLVLTYPGLIGLNGLNDRGIALACNTLLELRGARDGLPQAFVVRGILAQATASDARDFLRQVRHASGQNYLLGTRAGVADFEASGSQVVELPLSERGTVGHTNHALVNDDRKPWHRRPDAQTDTATRLASLEQRLTQARGPFRFEQVVETLRAKDSARFPICRPVSAGGPIFTFAGVVMNLGERPALEVTAGPPDAHPFTRFEFGTAAEPMWLGQ